MADRSAIEWTDATFNPWIGCTKISPACDHCYAAVSTPARALGVTWGAGHPRRRTSPANWKLPLRWNRDHPAFFAEHGRRRRVFCASLADVFDNEVDPAWRRDLFELIRLTPNLDWLLLTKRIGNADRMIADAVSALPRDDRSGTGQWNHHPIAQWPWPNVWLGATICNQPEADRDIPKLLAVPARVRFLSIEPMLGPVDLTEWLFPFEPCMNCPCPDPGTDRTGYDWCCKEPELMNPNIDWVIAGGESGPDARPAHPDWFRSLRDQCAAAGVPFLFKQWGAWRPPLDGEDYDTSMGMGQRVPCFIVSPNGTVHCFQSDWTKDGSVMRSVGKKAAGRLLDGVEHNAMPEFVP